MTIGPKIQKNCKTVVNFDVLIEKVKKNEFTSFKNLS